MTNDDDYKRVREALEGTGELDADVLIRVLDTAENARIDAIVECVAHLNERATIAELSKDAASAAVLLRGAQTLMEFAGFHRTPCPYCRAARTHTAECSLGRAVRKWRHALVPGKAKLSS